MEAGLLIMAETTEC